jgi:hypothetical protein
MRLAATTLLATLLLAPSLAGCLDPITDRLRASDVEAPTWRVGDWWTYRLNSTTYDLDAEITIVVANVTPSGYVLGYPASMDATLPLLFHMPAIGPVSRELTYDVHERRFEPLQWPLDEGKTWTTTWISAEVTLELRQVDGKWRANNSATADASGLIYEIDYDPAAKAISRFTRVGHDGIVRQQVELVGNGTGHVGDVLAPGGIRVVLLASRTAGTMSGGAPTSPQTAFTPPEGVDTLLVGCIAGGAPGEYHAEVRTGAGVVCSVDATVPPGAATYQLQIVEAPADGAGWESRLVAIGQGSATAEVLGYATRIVTLGP